MSVRARQAVFFVLIVVVPIAAIGVLMFSLINDSEQGKADARASVGSALRRSITGFARSMTPASWPVSATRCAGATSSASGSTGSATYLRR